MASMSEEDLMGVLDMEDMLESRLQRRQLATRKGSSSHLTTLSKKLVDLCVI